MNPKNRRVAYDVLLNFAVDIFKANGVPPEDADLVVRCLLDANLRGIDTHGVTRVRLYVDRIKVGGINPRPQIRLERKGAALGHLNGDDGLGQVVGTRLMEATMEMAREAGSAVVVCNHCNHLGALATYVDVAARAGFLATMAQGTVPNMAPYGGMHPVLGNNPIAHSFPTGGDTPFVLDIALSAGAKGKVVLAAKEQNSIPEGLAIDSAGRPTADAQAALNGAMLPMAGHKGTGLAIAVEAMTSLVSGAAFGLGMAKPGNPGAPNNIGAYATAVDISRLMSLGEFQSRADTYLSGIRNSTPAPGIDAVRIPGDRAYTLSQERFSQGIPLGAGVLKELLDLGKEFNIDTSQLEGQS